MPKFKFEIDRQCTVWFREIHEVEAETIEKAKEIMLKNDSENNTCATYCYNEMIYDTIHDTNDYEIHIEGETIYSNLI